MKHKLFKTIIENVFTCFIMSVVVGTQYMVDLINLGDALPPSCTVKSVVTKGGTRPL